jgi:hypothetical protein
MPAGELPGIDLGARWFAGSAEYVYAQRVAPEWLYAPQRGMRRLLD